MKRLIFLLPLALIAAGPNPIKNAKFQGAATFDTGASIDFQGATVLNLSQATGLPPMSGHNGQWLTTDGSIALWSVLPTLDALPAPVADLSIAGFKLINVATPVSATDGANKSYVDSLVNGLQIKSPVVVASTANLTLSGAQTIDGVGVIAGNRVLVKDQSSPAQNGIYVVASGAWTRATDADSQAELLLATVIIQLGSVNRGSQWTCTTPAPITVGVTALTFTQSGASLAGLPRYDLTGTWSAAQTMPVIDSGGNIADVRAFGAAMDGTTDDTAALRAAISSARSSKSPRIVYIPPGKLAVTDTITIDGTSGNPVMIEGAGSGYGIQPGNYSPSIVPVESVIMWGGAPPIGLSGPERPIISFVNCNSGGHGLKNIRIDNNTNNGQGISIDRCAYGTYENVSVVGMALDVSNSYGLKLWSSDAVLNTSYNAFRNLYIEGNFGNTTADNQGRCLWLHGTSVDPIANPTGADAKYNTFVNTTIFTAGSRHGIELGFADHNTFINTVVQKATGAGDGVLCNYRNLQSHLNPANNVFIYVNAFPWVNSTGAQSNNAIGNIAIGFETGGGSTEPVINSGYLKRISERGESEGGMGQVNAFTGSVIDWDYGDVQMTTLTATTNFTFANIHSGQHLTLFVNTNTHTCTFPATVSFITGYNPDGTVTSTVSIPVKWAGGGPPTPSLFCKFEFTFQASATNASFIYANGFVGAP